MKPNANFDTGGFSPKSSGNDSADNRLRQMTGDLTILRRIAKNDKSAIKDCVEVYGSKIWTMVKSFTDSPRQAEIITQEIFLDIWKNAERFGATGISERVVVALISRRRIKAYLNQIYSLDLLSKTSPAAEIFT